MKAGIVILFLCLETLLSMAQERSVSFESGDFSLALTKAKQQNKWLFIDFYTEWCAPCKQMSKEVFTKNEVADYFNHHFISIKIDADKGEGRKLSSDFQIKAYPTFVIIDAKGNEVYRTCGALPYDQFLAKIEKGLDPKRTLEVLQERYAKGERNRSLIYDYIFSLLEKKEEKRAKEVMDDYYNSLSDKKKMKPENFFLYNRYFSEDTPDNPKIRFLFCNKKQFYETVGKNKVEALMYEWLETELFVYASDYNFNENHFDKAAFAKLEDKVQEAALTDREDLTALCKIANARVKGDSEQYVDVCKAVFPHLNKKQRLRIMINFGGLRDVPERKVREKAIDLLGDYFSELKGADVQIIKWVIADLERPAPYIFVANICGAEKGRVIFNRFSDLHSKADTAFIRNGRVRMRIESVDTVRATIKLECEGVGTHPCIDVLVVPGEKAEANIVVQQAKPVIVKWIKKGEL